jgi:hypothetical protein
MGKSLRSSSLKTNNKKLRKNVFGPVETARTQRLSQKLQDLASQPKPPKADMEVEHASGKNSLLLPCLVHRADTLPLTDPKQPESEAKAATANGALHALSIPVPHTLATTATSASAAAAASTNMLTPLPTPPLNISDFTKRSVRTAHKRCADEQLFFHLLGVSTDIQGFDPFGNLCLGFGHDPESDSESSSSRSSSSNSSVDSGYE